MNKKPKIPQVNFIPALMQLPLETMLPFVNQLMQGATQREIGEACFDFGVRLNMTFNDIESDKQGASDRNQRGLSE